MFEQLDAKRVRRTELQSSSSSPDPSEADVEYDALLKVKLAELYGPVSDTGLLQGASIEDTAGDPAVNGSDDAATEAQDEGFEFRLFASHLAPKHHSGDDDVTHHRTDCGGTTKIILEPEDDGALNGPGGFIVPHRDPTYYFAPSAQGQRKRDFELAAMTGEEVRRWLAVRYRGWEVPWRVRTLHSASTHPPTAARLRWRDRNDVSRITALGDLTLEVATGQRKKKPGKKRRIMLRMKKRAEEAARERQREERQAREETDREKRTRRNREKKVKKKMREKAKKAAAGVGSAAGEVSTGARPNLDHDHEHAREAAETDSEDL